MKIKYAIVLFFTYSVYMSNGGIVDFWMTVYLQNQGLYVSAHKISQLYELFSLFGGIILGFLVDGILKPFKITMLCFLSLLSAALLIFIQYHYKRIYYFVIVSMVGLIMGSGINYMMAVTG